MRRGHGCGFRPTHVAVFDFDGTLIQGSIYQYLIEAGVMKPAFLPDKELASRCLATHGLLTIENEWEWIQAAVRSLSFPTVAQISSVLREINLREGVYECLEYLRQQRVPVAVVSYGFAELIRKVLDFNAVRDYFDAIYGTELTLDDGQTTGVDEISENSRRRFNGWLPHTVVTPSQKGDFSLRFAKKKWGVIGQNVLAVGDSASDKTLGYLRDNRFGIASDEEAAEIIRPVMGEVVISSDFWPVLDWLKRKIEGGN